MMKKWTDLQKNDVEMALQNISSNTHQNRK